MLRKAPVNEGIFHYVGFIVVPFIVAARSGEVLIPTALRLAGRNRRHLAEGEDHFGGACIYENSIGPGEKKERGKKEGLLAEED